MTIDLGRQAFLAHLSRNHEGFLVWKHLDRALRGQGDVDAAAPADTVDALLRDAQAIATTHLNASHVISCQHVADKRLQFYVQPDRLPQLFELDVCAQPSRGLAPWAHPADMAALSVLNPAGIRRLLPGAEAVVSLVYHGISSRGRRRLHGDEANIVRRGLEVDFDGAVMACDSLVPPAARPSLRRLVKLCRDGRWNGLLSSTAYTGFLVDGLNHPGFLSRRMAFRVGLLAGHECVMSDLARHRSRQVPPLGVPALLRQARAQGHLVQDL